MTSPPDESQREMLSLLTARVRDAYVRPPFVVDGSQDVASVCGEMRARGLTHALVRDGADDTGRLGIFTTTDLRDAVALGRPPAAVAVRELARFEVVEIEADAEAFEALWLMVRHRVHRLVVRDGSRLLGVLGQIDLLGFVANHSHFVGMQIDEAASIDELRVAALRVEAIVERLHGNGIRIERITRIVSELNQRLFARAWSLVAPPELVADSCLVVMGSEGRGEQILKTDQDNALILRDGAAVTGLDEARRRFGAALSAFGYPPCPGGIMLTEPAWCQPATAFRATIDGWLKGRDPQGLMHLAIFFDAAPVAGDASLLAGLRECLDDQAANRESLLASFAAAADQFREPSRWFAVLTARRDHVALDLKKLGLFPIVHGTRALALRHHVRERGTAKRLAALAALQALDAELVRDLVDALHLLMGLRLTHQLRQRAQGGAIDNMVRPSELGAIEREGLHDALAIVGRWRALLRQRFHLDAI